MMQKDVGFLAHLTGQWTEYSFFCSAMTLTHVSGVSGLSESLAPEAEQTQEETSLEEEVNSLKKQVEENEAEIERYGV